MNDIEKKVITEETQDQAVMTMEDVESTLVQLRPGQVVTGTVVQITEDEVCVNVGYKSDGIVKKSDLSSTDVKIGDEIEAEVVKVNDGEGNVLLSQKNIINRKAWEDIVAKQEAGEFVDGVGKEAVKGGVVTFIDGIRAFIPASKLALDYVEDLSTFVGQTIPARIIQAEREGRKLILSSRDVLRDRRAEAKAARVAAIQEGAVLDGKVDSLQSYGAFVSLGDGIDGLVHISQITNTKRLKHPKEMLNVGDEVKVKVIGVKDGKISLSMKALEEVPEDAKPAARERDRDRDHREREEKIEIPKSEKLTTNLGDLLKGIKLN